MLLNPTQSLLEILDKSLNGIMVFDAVRDKGQNINDFRWRYINSEAGRLIGRKPDHLMEKLLLDEMPRNVKQGLLKQYTEVVETGRSRVFDMQYVDETLNRWFHVQAAKLEDGLVVTFFDITSLKTVEAELLRKEKLLSEAQDLANMGSWSWNLSRDRVEWSAKVYEIFEQQIDFEPSYEFFIDCVVPEDREHVEQTISKAIEEAAPYEIIFRIHRGGSIKYLETRAIPKLGADRKIQEYLGIIRDITIDTTQEELERKSQNRARRIEQVASSERMAKSIAHEIRNPLTNITLATEQLKSSEDAESRELFLDMISRNCRRIEGLIIRLMDSAGQATLNIGPYNINEILDTAVNLAMDRIKLKGVEIIKDYQLEMCDISVDQQKVTTALLNIIINAIEAMESGGELKIVTNLKPEECLVWVSDNGIGIEKSKLNQLFDPFYTGKKKGLGLGLTTALNIFNSHDANVEVESRLHEGTTFKISFKRD